MVVLVTSITKLINQLPSYNWSYDEAKKNIFRTHTTAVSSKMLYHLSQEYKEKGYFPKKYFSIDRFFRNIYLL